MSDSRPDSARIMGHEALVRLDRGAPPASQSNSSARFVLNPVNSLRQDDVIGHSRPGMLQSSVALPSTWIPERLVPLAEGVPAVLSPLSEPVGVALYALDLLGLASTARRRLLCIGAGPIGATISLVASLTCGAYTAVVDISPSRVDRAVSKKLSDQGYVTGTRTELRRVLQLFQPDTIAICVPRDARIKTLKAVAEIVESGTIIDLVTGFEPTDHIRELPGFFPSAVRRGNVCGVTSRGGIESVRRSDGLLVRFTGHRGTSPDHLRRAMALISESPQRFGELITDVVPFGKVPEMVASIMKARRDPERAHYRKVLVDMVTSD